MSDVGLTLRRLLATSLVALGALDGRLPDSPQRILVGSDVVDGRAFLAGVRAVRGARRIAPRTGQTAFQLWWRGVPVRCVVRRADVSVEPDASIEFPSGLVLIGRVAPAGRAVRVTPRRGELAALRLIVVLGRQRGRLRA